MAIPIIEVLRKAIREKIVCSIRLAGEPSYRLVHPYGICILSTSKTSIVCWQLSGHSGSGSLPGFRHLSFVRCEDIVLLEEKFSVRAEFDPSTKMYRKWLLRVD